jgi:hypothetical protein
LQKQAQRKNASPLRRDKVFRLRVINPVFTVILVLLMAHLLSSCAQQPTKLRQNLGDQIIARLHIGMTGSEVDGATAELKAYVIRESEMTLKSERDIFRRYSDDYFPKDLLSSVAVGTKFKSVVYWINYAGRNMGTLDLFFDDSTQKLRGWINSESAYSRDRFLHERLTSKLKLSFDSRSRLTKSQVHALIGLPTRVIAPAQRESTSLYYDHFWQTDSARTPTVANTDELEVYEYALATGETRHVYVGYTRANDKLIIYGYDHAWEEAERYARERAK